MKAKEFLSQQGVPYEVKWVDRDRNAAIEMIRRSGQQGVPVIAIDDQIVVGFNKPRLEQLLAMRRPPGPPPAPRPSLGAQVADARTIMLKRGAPAQDGAYVGNVRPGTPADAAGLRSGDIITAVNGQPVRTAADLARLLAALPLGSEPTLTVQNAGGTRQVAAHFESSPASTAS